VLISFFGLIHQFLKPWRHLFFQCVLLIDVAKNSSTDFNRNQYDSFHFRHVEFPFRCLLIK
jgi:hypothetical protein